MIKVFIDGSQGTTGLKIYDRLQQRCDVELIKLPHQLRKDSNARVAALRSADVAFLCLPDAAAIEVVNQAGNCNTVIIDTSTAHRTDEDWTYGFPEVSSELAEKLKTSNRIAVPGCHASGFIALVKPLIDNGFISKDTALCCQSITGYSGGGKSMIADYQADDKPELLSSPRQYGLNQNHKHLREMVQLVGLETDPIFCPIVDDYYSGMLVTVPLFAKDLENGKTTEDIKKLYRAMYKSEIVSYFEFIDRDGFIDAGQKSGYDSMQITVSGNDKRILLIARYDNLGKGASGAAVQCMNIRMGLCEKTDLVL